MKGRGTVLPIALAILVTIVFSVVISLIFMSSVDSVVEETKPDDLLVDDAPTATAPTDQTPTPTVSLEYSSNGNGTCTVIGIGSCADPSIVIPEYTKTGERVTAIAPEAFYACPTVTAVHIPASVTFIGALAFADCKNLSYISVNRDNNAYRDLDGVLYSADLSTLISYPPKRAGESVTIYAGTSVIREMAFFECAYLKQIVFTGSPAQWEKISVGSKNYTLLAVSKSFGG